jgi:phage terminase large subunit-like protein
MYLMNLEAAKGQILQVNWLEPQFPAEKIETDWPMYYGVDPAISSKDVAPRSSGQRSFFALAKWVVAPFGMILVGGVVARDVGLYKAIEIVKSHAAVDNPRRTGIEIWGAGELFYQQLLKEAPELNLFRVKDTSDKATRFSRMARHFEAGRVKISNAENQFLREFRDEWSGFAPGSRWNTDALDAAFIGLESSGYQVYVGEKLLVPKEKGIIQMEKTPWGPTWGIPGSKFAPSWGAARRRVP